MLVTLGALGVGAALAGAAVPRWSWRPVGALLMVAGTAAMLRVSSAAGSSLLALVFLGVAGVEVWRLARAFRFAGDRIEPFVGLCCAAAMVAMALAMTPMPGMTHGAMSLPPGVVVTVLGLLVVGLLAALSRVVVVPAAHTHPLRRVACTTSHCLLCVGMALPIVIAL